MPESKRKKRSATAKSSKVSGTSSVEAQAKQLASEIIERRKAARATHAAALERGKDNSTAALRRWLASVARASSSQPQARSIP